MRPTDVFIIYQPSIAVSSVYVSICEQIPKYSLHKELACLAGSNETITQNVSNVRD